MTELSACCDARRWLETGHCSACREFADFYIDGDPVNITRTDLIKNYRNLTYYGV